MSSTFPQTGAAARRVTILEPKEIFGAPNQCQVPKQMLLAQPFAPMFYNFGQFLNTIFRLPSQTQGRIAQETAKNDGFRAHVAKPQRPAGGCNNVSSRCLNLHVVLRFVHTCLRARHKLLKIYLNVCLVNIWCSDICFDLI